MKNLLQIAIDGPAASGKSTVAKRVAQELGLLYIDSGAMYRAVTLFVLRAIDPDLSCSEYHEKINENLVNSLLDQIDIKLEDNSKKIYVNGEDVSEAIRTNLVSKHVSIVAAYKQVRERLVALQRKISESFSVIMDGRDIGTVVFPNADLKIFMVASAKVRAERRYKELSARGEKVDLDQLIKEIETRDHLDSSRSEAPLLKASSAIEINTDGMGIEDVVITVLRLSKC